MSPSRLLVSGGCKSRIPCIYNEICMPLPWESLPKLLVCSGRFGQVLGISRRYMQNLDVSGRVWNVASWA